jgi:tellurite resistance protein TerC
MIWFWVGFGVLILTLLALDLGVFHKEAHEVKVKEALMWSAVWIAMGLSFSAFIYFAYAGHWMGIGLTTDLMSVSATNPLGHNGGGDALLKYLTGYLIEKSLSVDNIFVISMVFTFTRVPARYRHRVLFWGILGALVMRGVMIGLGVELIRRFSWTVYVFGGILILTAAKMLFMDDEESSDPSTSGVVRWARKLMPVTSHFHEGHFFVRAGSHESHEPAVPGGVVQRDAAVENAKRGTLMATPLFITLIIVEFTDLVFAVDSIPAIFAITTDPFLIFTSNVFAILGLRSLYFALEGMIGSFRYLKTALAFVLILVGVKMMFHGFFKQLLGEHFNLWILALVFLILGAGVGASMAFPEKKKEG